VSAPAPSPPDAAVGATSLAVLVGAGLPSAQASVTARPAGLHVTGHVALRSMDNFAPMNDVYRTMIPAGTYPARSAFGTSGLALDARLEIECIAVVK
jgi:hypothetical protein